ncbi:hypothetical protein [Arthrobacter sp. B10-11]|uniref:hypothetical protein n=1 Tax=Arthrobacter sp. B10-11 TaxID=3081160 RepID=UPI0029539E60|nr:hypothetical protein [Arthrobacter sp. B10-11]MDV8148708.1 hypothetical protein [Arthrobacter sp. B10-11]
MSEDNPDVPRNPRPPQPPPPPADGHGTPQEPAGGSMALGAVLGALVLYVVYVGSLMAAGPYAWGSFGLGGLAGFIPIVIYLLVAILLAVRRRTSRFGAGLLIGLGIFVLFGGGLCVGALTQMGA